MVDHSPGEDMARGGDLTNPAVNITNSVIHNWTRLQEDQRIVISFNKSHRLCRRMCRLGYGCNFHSSVSTLIKVKQHQQSHSKPASASGFHRSAQRCFLDLRQHPTASSRPGLRSPRPVPHLSAASTPAWQPCTPAARTHRRLKHLCGTGDAPSSHPSRLTADWGNLQYTGTLIMSSVKSVSNIARTVHRRPFRVSIEGNIGSGKSTCIKFFEKYPVLEKHPEPINEWRNVSGHNLLALVYSDLDKWTFPFQHYVHLTRLKIQTSPPSNPKITVKMFERSVQNSRFCFVENAKRQGYLHDAEYQVLNNWYENVSKNLDISLDLIVYLKTSPEVVFERMIKRGRAEESEVPLEYLQQVHDAYENWLNSTDVGCEVLTIDANRSIDMVKEDLERYSYKILGGNHTN
ncbi:hypothetical protein evm_013649 [Chilo suppressalis]|nr:hypothetical protein evm_013649 [Chilo suppressalis]